METGNRRKRGFSSKYLLLLIFFSSTRLMAAKGVLSYERFQRLNKPKAESSASDWIGASFQTKKTKKEVDSHVDGDFRFYLGDANQMNYSLSEGYVQFNAPKSSTSVGRKLVDWSPSEKYWMLGNLNGLQAFDLLGDKQEGLIGLHHSHELGDFSVDVFMSWVYLPELNPSIEIADGKVTSSSEWSRRPPTDAVLNEQSIPIFYRVNYPATSDIIFKKSLGGNLRYNWRDGNFNFYGIYKPENSLRINAQGELVRDPQNNYHIDVLADPVVNHHIMFGSHIQQKISVFKWRGGVDYVDPNARLGQDFKILDPVQLKESKRTFETPNFKIEPNYKREAYFTTALNYKNLRYETSVNYIHQLLTNEGGDDFYSDPVKWQRAIGGSVRYFFSDNLNILADLKFDLKRRDNVFKGELSYLFQKSFGMRLGMELLRSPLEESYWSPYRANDTFYSSLGYHF